MWMLNFNSSTSQNRVGTEYLIDQESGFYVEEYFQEVLTMERRRSERSRKRFMLMLLDIRGLIAGNGDAGIMKKLNHVLFESTREIDIKGWYERASVIGIIFTEINGVGAGSLVEKIVSSLRAEFTKEQVGGIAISCYVFPEEAGMGKADHPGPDPKLYPDLSKPSASMKFSMLLKRALDIAGSIFCIVVFSPFFLVLPLMIKLGSLGPVLFKQERLGQFGKTYYVLKFRTMHMNCDDEIHRKYVKELIQNRGGGKGSGENGNGGCYKITNDPRVTRIGRFLRKSSLDELPQFINVLKGEMSLVGPRPPIPYELENYDIWHRRRVLEVKPGITGIWQVEGRSSTTFDEMVRMDIRYIKRRSLLLDMKLLFKTPWVVLIGKGAY